MGFTPKRTHPLPLSHKDIQQRSTYLHHPFPALPLNFKNTHYIAENELN
jgi:hypothetical protein